MGLSFLCPGSNTCINCGGPDKTSYCLSALMVFTSKERQQCMWKCYLFTQTSNFQEIISRNLLPSSKPFGQQIIHFAYRQTTLMTNSSPTSCTDAYIKVNNTHSHPVKCGHHIAPGSKAVWLTTLHFCALSEVWEKSQGKTHQLEQTCNLHQWRCFYITALTVLSTFL